MIHEVRRLVRAPDLHESCQHTYALKHELFIFRCLVVFLNCYDIANENFLNSLCAAELLLFPCDAFAASHLLASGFSATTAAFKKRVGMVIIRAVKR